METLVQVQEKQPQVFKPTMGTTGEFYFRRYTYSHNETFLRFIADSIAESLKLSNPEKVKESYKFSSNTMNDNSSECCLKIDTYNDYGIYFYINSYDLAVNSNKNKLIGKIVKIYIYDKDIDPIKFIILKPSDLVCVTYLPLFINMVYRKSPIFCTGYFDKIFTLKYSGNEYEMNIRANILKPSYRSLSSVKWFFDSYFAKGFFNADKVSYLNYKERKLKEMAEAKATPVVENKVIYGINSNSEYEAKPTEICYALFVQRKPEEIPEEVPEGIPVEPIAEKIIVTRTHEEVKAKEVPNVYFNGINNPVDYEKKYNDSIITIKDLSTKLEIFNDKLVNANKQYANLVVINKKQAELIKKLNGSDSESIMELQDKYNSLVEENTTLKDQVKDLESKYAIAMVDIEKAEKQFEQEEELYKRRLLDQKANIRRDLDKRIEELTKENATLKQANAIASTPATKLENNLYQVAVFDFPIYMKNMVFKPAGSFDIDICDEYYDELVNLIKSSIKDKTDIVVDINNNEDLKVLIKRKIHTYGNDYRMMPLMMAFTNCELDENLRKLAFGVIAYINGK
jgi:hypothetical protein